MRRGQKPEILFSEKGAVIGVNLGYDFVAEHEWGISELKQTFGISDAITDYGMIRRKVSVRPKTLSWIKYKKEGDTLEGFSFRRHIWGDANENEAKNPELYIYKPDRLREGEKPQTLAAAWSEHDFAIISKDTQQIAQLQELYNQFDSLNIVIMLSGRSNPFANSGLVIAIADRIPQTYVDAWYVADKDQHEIQKEFKATGIEELLAKAKKRYFALSPHRQADGSLKYWLNPREQRENSCGWFTLRDLELWAVGEGPIPMTHKRTRAC